MPFILNEDKALKTMLSGITVSDDKNPSRPVGVWFGQPDLEIQAQAYPYITIDLIDVSEATDRAMRGTVRSDWWSHLPEGQVPLRDGEIVQWDYPIPYNLDYQITTWARHPRHDRAILTALYGSIITPKYRMLYVPEDNTDRSMFLLGMAKRDQTEQARRVFSNVLTVRIHSEMLLEEVVRAQQVFRIKVNAHDMDT